MLGKIGDWLGGLFGRKQSAESELSGDAAEQLATFQEALCAVSPDFQRYARLAGDDAAEGAVRSVYAALPPTGKVSRTAVARDFLLRLAQEAEDEDGAQAIAALSDRQVAIVARRAGVAI
ncbi:MAG TPA: hypothetical protein VFN74_12970 [Chloroflexota bacterium]|nr:hypothetical protein [Chloroflexota bacterium]